MLWTTVLLTAAATLLFELVTCIGRFGFGIRSAQIAPKYRRYTFGVRIHHGYVGAFALPPAFAVSPDPLVQAALLAFAGGLILSDLLHHLVVLPLVTRGRD